MNSLKLTVTRARVGRPSSRNLMNFWLARASTQRTHLFVVCSQRLCDLVNDGGTWQWQDLGQPAK